MAVLRFPNPGSDLTRIVHIFSLVCLEFGDNAFDLDAMVEVATRNLQASSVGAQGTTAIARSTRADRSRDPLFNQLKMYSELYRMFGWMRPTPQRRQVFRATESGATITAWYAARRQAQWVGLLEEALLGVVFPNPITENLGVVSQRPFVWLLELMTALDNVITRHEMIVGLLHETDDQDEDALAKVVIAIQRLRAGPYDGMVQAAEQIARTNGVQRNTLENYTRLPVGVLKSSVLGWGTSSRRRDLYQTTRAVSCLELSDRGRRLAADLVTRRDVRVSELAPFDDITRAAFATYAYGQSMFRAGVVPDAPSYDAAARRCGSMFEQLGVSSGKHLLFNPDLQETDAVLDAALLQGPPA